MRKIFLFLLFFNIIIKPNYLVIAKEEDMMLLKRVWVGCITFLFLFLIPITSIAAPNIFYTDIISGPNTGGENNNGAYLSIFGKNFGNDKSKIKVYVGKGEVARYIYLGQSLGRSDVQQLSVQLGPNVSTGAIRVVVDGVESNTDHTFTIRAGNFYFVSLTGNDKAGRVNDIKSPYRTPNYIRNLSVFNAGDLIIVREGTYDLDDGTNNLYERTFLRVNKSGTTGNPMTFMGYPGETVNIQMDTSNMLIANGVVVTDWVVANFVVSINHCQSGNVINLGGTTTTAVCHDKTGAIGGKASRIRVVNIEIDGHDIGGLCSGQGDNIAEIGYSDNIKILGISIHNTSPLLIGSERSHLIYLATRQTNTEVGWNQVNNIPASRAVVQVHQDPFGGACFGEKYLTDIKIHDNVLYNIAGQAILLDGGTGDIDVYNNVIYNATLFNGDYSGDIVSLRGSGGRLNAMLYNNTIYANPMYTQSGILLIMGMSGYFPEHVTLYNNILYLKESQDLYYGTENSNSSLQNWINSGGITSSYNLWYGAGSPPSWATNSVNADPQFVNPTGGDFHLQSASPAINKGTAPEGLSKVVTKDFDGNVRPQGVGYDIGAYEYINKK